MRVLRQHFSIAFAGKSFSFAGGLVANIFITRLLGQEANGLLSYMQSNIMLLTLMLGFTLPTGITFFLANRKLPEGPFIGVSYLIALLSTALVSLIILVSLSFPENSLLLPKGHKNIFL